MSNENAGGERKRMYDRELDALLTQIDTICTSHDIPYLLVFQLDDEQDLVRFARGWHLPEWAAHRLHMMQTIYQAEDMAPVLKQWLLDPT